MKQLIKRIPIVRNFASQIRARIKLLAFPGSSSYWEQRYREGIDSGVGSYGKFAEFKAEILNKFVADRRIQSVIEFGCGDGNQLSLARYPEYLGFDISETAVAKCRDLFAGDASKRFFLMNQYAGHTAQLTLSLDVIFHLVEDNVFHQYMNGLFGASTQFVVIYSSNFEDGSVRETAHVRHREFTKWTQTHALNWKLIERIPNKFPYSGDYTVSSFADFYVFEKVS